jgi:oxygen-independent coproporphyrinogen-3 oxidase
MTDLSLYLHIPFCRRRCGYCSFVTFAGLEPAVEPYTRALAEELRLTRRTGTAVKSIYFGGGTPSLLPAAAVSRLLGNISELYSIDPDAEITLEANPGTIDGEYLAEIRAAGVNRLSVGIQSLTDGDLAFLGRLHNVAEARRLIQLSRAAGFDNLSADFIYGLPGRRLPDWDRILNAIVELGVEHLSLYGLTLEPETPLGTAAGRGEFTPATSDEAASEYELASEKLAAAGYRQYEISNWARLGRESRHNTVYWLGGDYLGAGVGAHSFISGQRIANTSDFGQYMTALGEGYLPPRETEAIDPSTALAEAIILGLRLTEGVSINDIKRRFSIDLCDRFTTQIAELTAYGLVETLAGRLRLTPKGRLLGNEVFIRFLPS